MFVVVATNPVLDNDIYVRELTPGKDITPLKSSFVAGGKAINVARISHLLAADPLVLGFVAGPSGALIQAALVQDKIAHHILEVQGDSRICTNIIERHADVQTCIHQHGQFHISSAQLDEFLQAYQKYLQRSTVAVLSGSLPRGLPISWYAQLIAIAHTAGVTCIVDTSGDALRAALPARPDIVKINHTEAAEFVGHQPTSRKEVVDACHVLASAGTALAIITCGEKGAIVFDARKAIAYHVVVPQIVTANTIGCGDAFTAGLAVALVRNETAPACYRLAAAVSVAAVLQDRAGFVEMTDIARFIADISVTEL